MYCVLAYLCVYSYLYNVTLTTHAAHTITRGRGSPFSSWACWSPAPPSVSDRTNTHNVDAIAPNSSWECVKTDKKGAQLWLFSTVRLEVGGGGGGGGCRNSYAMYICPHSQTRKGPWRYVQGNTEMLQWLLTHRELDRASVRDLRLAVAHEVQSTRRYEYCFRLLDHTPATRIFLPSLLTGCIACIACPSHDGLHAPILSVSMSCGIGS